MSVHYNRSIKYVSGRVQKSLKSKFGHWDAERGDSEHSNKSWILSLYYGKMCHKGHIVNSENRHKTESKQKYSKVLQAPHHSINSNNSKYRVLDLHSGKINLVFTYLLQKMLQYSTSSLCFLENECMCSHSSFCCFWPKEYISLLKWYKRELLYISIFPLWQSSQGSL